jgi:hypothetical protein
MLVQRLPTARPHTAFRDRGFGSRWRLQRKSDLKPPPSAAVTFRMVIVPACVRRRATCKAAPVPSARVIMTRFVSRLQFPRELDCPLDIFSCDAVVSTE